MKGERDVFWSRVGNGIVVAAAGTTILAFVGELTPDPWKVSARIGVIAAFLALLVGFYSVPIVRAVIQRHQRLIRGAAIALLIPFGHYFFLSTSWRSVLVACVDASAVLFIVHFSQEWRKIRPIRSRPPGTALAWGGITVDEVGRGPGRREPDGVPDGLFTLRVPASEAQVARIVLRRLTPDKRPTAELWRSDPQPHRNWVLGVVVDGQRVDPDRSGSLRLDRAQARRIELYASDSWSSPGWFRSGEQYEVDVMTAQGGTETFHTMIS